jgi:hypothetical protein
MSMMEVGKVLRYVAPISGDLDHKGALILILKYDPGNSLTFRNLMTGKEKRSTASINRDGRGNGSGIQRFKEL